MNDLKLPSSGLEEPSANAQPSEALDEAALAWMVRLHSGADSAAERGAFLAWRRQSLAHERAAREAEALWRDIGFTEAAQASQPRRRTSASARIALAAAGLLAALTGGAAFDHFWPVGGWTALTADLRTGVGERRDLRLADGSMLHLNAGTAVNIEFGEHSRRIVLLAGELSVDVAADAARPFVVRSGGGASVALGTVYDVRRDGPMTTVTVLESRVRVAYPSGDNPEREARVLGPGERLRYGADGGLGPVERVDAEAHTAWRRGKFIFDGARLDDVVAEVNRHRTGRIVIVEESLRDLKVTGVFDLAAPDAVLAAIEKNLQVSVTRLPYVTLLR